MTRWETFRDKYLGKISTILSWIFNVAGLVLAILSFIKNDADLGWGVVLSLIIFNSIFLIIISIYETLLFKRGATLEKDIIKEKDEAIEQLKLQLKLSNNQSDKLLEFPQNYPHQINLPHSVIHNFQKMPKI